MQIMFTWWISWLWAWLLWCCCAPVVIDGVFTAKMVQELSGRPRNRATPNKETGGKMDVEFGGGLGGSAIETPTLEGLQYFATQPSAQTAIVGSTVILPCRVVNKVGHLQWTKDGFGLGTDRELDGFARYTMIGSDDEGDFSLRIEPVLLSDDGTFQCQVSAAAGIPGIRSPEARLRVYMPPGPPIIEPPEITATAGMTVNVNCTSKGGRPPPEIQWVDDSAMDTIRTGTLQLFTLKYPDKKRVTVTSQLTFKARKAHHNSSITCLTSNQALTSPLSGKVNLQVLFPPEVELRVRPQNLVEGDEASFTCTANANPNQLSYRWFHNSRQFHEESSPSLILRNVSRELHRDSISCEASNSVGSSKKSVILQVQYGPRFRSPTEDVAAETGMTASLECDVDSNPLAIISWYQQGSRQVLSTGKVLEVRVSPSTSGVYVCVATVRGFPGIQRRVRVLVKGPPLIVSPSEQRGRLGDTVRVECTTVSIPPPLSVSWTHRGKIVDLSDPRYEMLQERELESEALRNLLLIHEAGEQVFGPYNCSVVNEYGIANKLIFLHKEKTIPLYVLVFGSVGVLSLAVIVISLVIYNKKFSSGKGPSLPEKSGGATPGPMVVNMYGAPSDTSISNDTSLTPTKPTFQQLTPAASYDNILAVHTIAMDSPQKSVKKRERTGGTPLTVFRYNGVWEHKPLPNGRPASVSDLDPSNSFIITSMGSPNSTISTNFCTIRRGTKAIDIGVKIGRPHVYNYTKIPPVPPVLSHNGASHQPYLRHSTHSLTSKVNLSSPPPPTYTRGPKIESPRGLSSPARSATPTMASSEMRSYGGTSPEAKFIFSPETMMKPGTLV